MGAGMVRKSHTEEVRLTWGGVGQDSAGAGGAVDR